MRWWTPLGVAALASVSTCKVRIPNGSEAEGDFPCETSETCPLPDHGCLLSACLEGQCVFVPAPNGVLPQEEQVVGDCRELACTGDGEIVAYAAYHDLPRDDGNPCTEAVCDVDVAKQEPRLAGAHCARPDGEEGVCNGSGRCGVCVPETDRCDDHAVVRCSADGEWGPPDTCTTAKPVCSQATCIGVVELAAADSHSCARFDDGSVRCWGNAAFGRLGSLGLAGSKQPAWVSGFSTLRTGRRHQCGIRKDGTVWCWGEGGFGQLGNDAHTSSAVPGATGVKATAVALGDDHACAIVAGGAVQCWGRNDHGQCGSGKASTKTLGKVAAMQPVQSGATPVTIGALTDAAALDLDGARTCVSRSGGQIRCWGITELGVAPESDAEVAPEVAAVTVKKPTAVRGIADAVAIGCSGQHCCVRRSGGGVSCWGAGANGKDAFAATPVTNVTKARQLGVGRRFACALLEGGSVWCWGDNDRGQLGRGGDQPSAGPAVIAKLGAVKTLAVGAAHACALLESGQVRCWGDNRIGQLARVGQRLSKEPAAIAWP